MPSRQGVWYRNTRTGLHRDFFEFEPYGRASGEGQRRAGQAYQLIKAVEVETRIAASAARGFTRFVGRKREIETLKEAFDKAQSGEGQVVGVVGEAGVGKSRMLLEFRSLSTAGPAHSIWRADACTTEAPCRTLPILDAFRSFVGIKEGDKESVIKQKMTEKIVGSR